MRQYEVELIPEDLSKINEHIHIFECLADDEEHAREQADNAYPHCYISCVQLM